MKPNYTLTFTVGLFVLAGIVAFLLLALKVSGLQNFSWHKDEFIIKANFSNIGGLKQRSRVSIGGVTVGRVVNITLDPGNNYDAIVEMSMKPDLLNKIPEDSVASIRTAGLIGDNFIAITPGAGDKFLQSGDVMTDTNSALVLEELISKFLVNKADKE